MAAEDGLKAQKRDVVYDTPSLFFYINPLFLITSIMANSLLLDLSKVAVLF